MVVNVKIQALHRSVVVERVVQDVALRIYVVQHVAENVDWDVYVV
jgi:hypothetical protein